MTLKRYAASPTCCVCGGSAPTPPAGARGAAAAARICAPKRNFPAVPEGVRDFLDAFLAAKYAGLSFEAFKSEMEQSEEFMALSAWRRAAEASPR